jgi:hypothetical protein
MYKQIKISESVVLFCLPGKYDTNIDDAIVKILLKEKKLTYSNLKRNLNKAVGRTLSYEPYQHHLDRMLKDNTLKKESSGQNRYYSLTGQSLGQLHLKILGNGKKQDIFKLIYEKILFFDFFERVKWFLLDYLERPGFVRILDRNIIF